MAAVGGAVLVAVALGAVLLLPDASGARRIVTDVVSAAKVDDGQGSAGDEQDLLAPDLQTLPPEELYVARNANTGARRLRFSTTVLSSDAGPLALVAT